uniref:Uncharacterized protein n=1 Tax=Tanacetum cinerariifolium TaxID=118510 RepID=A0A6L2JJ07_TANCI|nr:hypothetical protein [Tanacetum cinerariifolium]
MSVVGPVWSDFMSKNINQDVKGLYFIKEGEDMFYVATYKKYGLEMHGYRQKSLMFWWCLLNVTDRSYKAQTLPLVFVPKVYSTSQSDTVNLFIKDRECEVFIDYNFERMGWYCNWRWHTNHGDEHKAFYIKLTSDVLILGRIRISKGFVDMHELRGYASAVACKKLALVGMHLQWVACSLIHAMAKIQAWGKPVRTDVDDVLLLAPVLKHVVPSLAA